MLLREHPCLALGWLPPACPPLPGAVGRGEGQLCQQNTAWCQVRCHLAGLSLCLSSLALSVQQGEVSSSTCSRGAGRAWAEVQAESVAGSRQGMGRDRQRVWQGAGSARTETQAAQHPFPLLAAALLGMLWCSPFRWNIQCWHRTGSESSGLTLHRSSQPLTEKTWPGGAGGQGTQSPGTRS